MDPSFAIWLVYAIILGAALGIIFVLPDNINKRMHLSSAEEVRRAVYRDQKAKQGTTMKEFNVLPNMNIKLPYKGDK